MMWLSPTGTYDTESFVLVDDPSPGGNVYDRIVKCRRSTLSSTDLYMSTPLEVYNSHEKYLHNM